MVKEWLLKYKGTFFLGNLGGEGGVDAWTSRASEGVVFSDSEKEAMTLTTWGKENVEWIESKETN